MEDNAKGYESDDDFMAKTAMENVSEEEESMMAWLVSLNNDDDEVTELSKLLEMTHPVNVKIIENPYWLPLIFQTAASYVTINGNDESCGSSFSDLDASYMAGINMGCGFVVGSGGAWDGDVEDSGGNCLVKALAGGESEDAMSKFLGDDFEQTR